MHLNRMKINAITVFKLGCSSYEFNSYLYEFFMLFENTNEFSKKTEKYEFSTIKHFSVEKPLVLKKILLATLAPCHTFYTLRFCSKYD